MADEKNQEAAAKCDDKDSTASKAEAPESAERVEELASDDDKDQTTVDGAQVSKVEGEDNQCDKVEDQSDSEWLDVLGSGQLRKKVLRPGQGEATRPERGMEVTIRLQSRLEDGTEVESCDKFTFTQGEGEIIQAIDLCVCLMELGEVAEIHSNSRFAYSEFGKEPHVPPNTDMVFEVELLEVKAPPTPLTMSVEECCQVADKKREYGNELFGRKDYSGAINAYTRALRFLDGAPDGSGDANEKLLNDLLVKCHNNLAAAQLKVEAYSAALKSCNSALNIDGNNVKALFRKGKVLSCQKEFTDAITSMKKALSLEPANKTIHQELSKLTASYQKEVQSEKEMYQRMVGDLASKPEAKQARKRSNAKWLLIGVSVVIGVIGVVLAVLLAE